MFREEAERLLDQKAESVIKHAVEQHTCGDISYEQYMEVIEQVSKEEEGRGATYGASYARNRVFDFAQNALDRAKERQHTLALADARKQFEEEKQKTNQILKEAVREGLEEVKTATQQHNADLETIVQQKQEALIATLTPILDRTKALIEQAETITDQQKDALRYNLEMVVEQTKTEISQILTNQLQAEMRRREEAIREEERLRPAREAAHAAMARVTTLSRRARSHRLAKMGIEILGLLCIVLLLIVSAFSLLPQWGIALFLAVTISLGLIAYRWKSPVPEKMLTDYQQQIAQFQTKSGPYASLSEEERCALLIQNIN